MTVAELIEKLKEMPQDEIACAYEGDADAYVPIIAVNVGLDCIQLQTEYAQYYL